MAKLALINREHKRAALVKKFAGKRAELKAIIDNQSKSEEERYEARLKLQALPRNSAPTRQRNRCALTCQCTAVTLTRRSRITWKRL